MDIAIVRFVGAGIAIAIAIAATIARAQIPPVRTLVPELTIDGTAAELTSIYALVVAPNGNIILLGKDEFRGKVFGPNGKLIRNFARGGHGPGEIATSNPGDAGMVGDTLWIFDNVSRRVALFTSEGKPIRDIIYNRSSAWKDSRPEWAGLSWNVRPERLLPGDIAFGVAIGSLGTKAFGRGVTQVDDGRVPLMQLKWDGTAVGPSLILPKQYRWFSLNVGPNRTQSFGQDLAHLPKYDISPDGNRVVIATVRDGQMPAVEVLHLSTRGDTLGKHRIPFMPDPITRRTVDSMVAEWVAPKPDVGRPAFLRPPASLAGRESEIRDSLIVPKYFPPFDQVKMANDGTTWLHWHVPGTGHRWLVVSARGQVLMQVEQPKGEVRLIDRGIWAIVYDSDGVPSVVRFGIATK